MADGFKREKTEAMTGQANKKKNSLAGSRTPLSRVTGACTNRYTTRDIYSKVLAKYI